MKDLVGKQDRELAPATEQRINRMSQSEACLQACRQHAAQRESRRCQGGSSGFKLQANAEATVEQRLGMLTQTITRLESNQDSFIRRVENLVRSMPTAGHADAPAPAASLSFGSRTEASAGGSAQPSVHWRATVKDDDEDSEANDADADADADGDDDDDARSAPAAEDPRPERSVLELSRKPPPGTGFLELSASLNRPLGFADQAKQRLSGHLGRMAATRMTEEPSSKGGLGQQQGFSRESVTAVNIIDDDAVDS